MNIFIDLDEVSNRIREVGRRLYYAKQLNKSKLIETHLDSMLLTLGIASPDEVGLSKSVLVKKVYVYGEER
jgi:hypothetical protein